MNRLDYDFNIHGGVFTSHIESCNSPKVARWLSSILHLIPVEPRPDGYSPLGIKNLEPKWVSRLGQSGRDCYEAIVRMDAKGLRLAIEGLCHEAGGMAEPSALEFWAALVHRQVLRVLQPAGGDPRLGQLWSTVRQDLGGAWNLRRMARCAGMSQESLRRLCLQHTGRPPLSQLTRLRMQFAADLLACSQEKIASLAARVGYGDGFSFSTAFKREMGMPPKRFRRINRAGEIRATGDVG